MALKIKKPKSKVSADKKDLLKKSDEAGSKKSLSDVIAELKLSEDKKGISHQIQNRIGKSVILVLVVIALLAIVMVNKIVTEANDTELRLESQVASHQLAEFLAPYETMTTQLAVNTELQLLMETLFYVEGITKHSAYLDVLENMQNIQALDSENIRVVWFGDIDASMAGQSDGYITEKGWDITTRPWFSCLEEKKTVYTVPYVDTATGDTVLSIATPSYNAFGKEIGVAGMDISLETMMTALLPIGNIIFQYYR